MAYNILFLTHNRACGTKGGTERATITVATALSKIFGCNCYSSYDLFEKAENEKCFTQEFCIGNKERSEKIIYILNRYKIDFLIVQGDFELIAEIQKDRLKNDTKLIFAHHFEPGWEEYFISSEAIKGEIRASQNIEKLKKIIKFFIYDAFARNYRKKQFPIQYAAAYNNSDSVVVLSEKYISLFARYAKLEKYNKCISIPNALSFDTFYEINKLKEKRKKVLIVARMEEVQKRIILALKIWSLVKTKKESQNWEFDIVGDGPDLDRYVSLAKKMKLKDITFYGRQIPIKFYEEASIFLMTSKSEGWGLTLVEAQQYGCIPLVFDTCPAFAEVINDGTNGFIVPEGDIKKYAKYILELMRNESRRMAMAENAIKLSKQFSQENIAKKWMKLFAKLR